jgi:hypothetical protein
MIYVIQVIYVFGFLTDELIRACTSKRTGLFFTMSMVLKRLIRCFKFAPALKSNSNSS